MAVSHQWPEYKKGEEEFIEFDITDNKVDLRTNSFYRQDTLRFWPSVTPRVKCWTDSSAASVKPTFTVMAVLLATAAVKLVQYV